MMLGPDNLSLIFSISHLLILYLIFMKLKRCTIGGLSIVANTKETLTLLGVVKYLSVLRVTEILYFWANLNIEYNNKQL